MFDENQIRINKGLDIDFELEEFQSDFVYFDKNNSYIVYFNDSLLGFYNVVKIDCENIITIEYSLLKSFRGLHCGQKFLETIIDIVSKEYPEVEKITLMIKYNNEISMKIAKKEEFSIDINLMEKLSDEISDYIPYSKSNKYYENKKLCLQK